jgi:hypothetical protein
MLTACVSSDVSITMMGVEELMSTLRRSRPSVILGPRAPTTRVELRSTDSRWRLSPHNLTFSKFDRVGMLPYNKEFGPTPNISLHLQR